MSDKPAGVTQPNQPVWVGVARAMASQAFGLALRLTGEVAMAEDAVQEAFLRLLRHSPEDRGPAELRGYFLRTVHNTALSMLESEAARARRQEARPMDGELHDADVSTEAARHEMAMLAQRALAGLPRDVRVAVSLCCEQGFTQREAAEITGAPEGTVARRVQRGLEALRDKMRSMGLAGAPPAVLAAMLGELGAPEAPASLTARLEAISGSKMTGSAAGISSKGGLFVKIGFGVAALGLAAGAALWAAGGSSQEPAAAPASAAGRRDPPEAQKYSLRVLVWCNKERFVLDGPAGQAAAGDLLKGCDVDDAGNVYWTECDSPVLRSYRADSDRVITLAGSIRGYADGPLDRARFGGWWYNGTNLLSVSGDGKHLFVFDRGASRWRYVDLAARTVSTVAEPDVAKNHLYIVRDKSGEIYAFRPSGEDAPDCPGYKKLKVAPFKQKGTWNGFDRWALDAEKMRFYWHRRGTIMMTDLKTGEESALTGKGSNGGGGRRKDTSGPLETTSFLCPTGMSISPGGRYLYIGQGDGSSCTRLDLEKQYTTIFGALDGGGFGWRETDGKDRNCVMTGATGWPTAPVFIPDGRGYWANVWGIYALTPVK